MSERVDERRYRGRSGRRRRRVYLAPGGSLTLLESHACGRISKVLEGKKGTVLAYQSLEDALSRGRAARLDFPDVVLGNLV